MIPWRRVRTAIRQPRKVVRAYGQRAWAGLAQGWEERRTYGFRLWLKLYRRLSRREVVFFVRQAGIGDIICTFPAVLALRERHPGALLIYAVRPEFLEVVEMGAVADLIFPIEKRGLRREDYDVGYQPLLDDEEPKGRAYVHLVSDFCQTLKVRPQSLQPRLRVPGKARRALAARIAPYRKKHRYVLGVHVGPTWKVKEWPEANWRELVARLRRELDCAVIQLGADMNTSRGRFPSVRVPGTIDWVGRLGLVGTCAAIQALDLLIGIDSGLLHIAGATGTPVVGLFGPTVPRRLLPPETPSIAVTSDVPCLGCHHREPRLHWQTGCPYNIACMKQLLPSAVFAAAEKLLNTRSSA